MVWGMYQLYIENQGALKSIFCFLPSFKESAYHLLDGKIEGYNNTTKLCYKGLENP
jgi:hypothetical protein